MPVPIPSWSISTRMARPIQPIQLTPEQEPILQRLARSRETPHSLVQRSQIVLQSAQGVTGKAISARLGVDEDTVVLWRKRWLAGSPALEKLAGHPGQLSAAIGGLLSDRPRPGSPGKFRAEQVCRIIALACEQPPPHLSQWSHEDLAREVVTRQIADSISTTSIGRFLKSGRPQTPP